MSLILERSIDQLKAFSDLSQEGRKAAIAAYTNIVAIDGETTRLNTAHPGLEDKIRVVSYLEGIKNGPTGTNFWTNRGQSFKATYEIAIPDGVPQTLGLDVMEWGIEARYATGSMGEVWITIQFNYRGRETSFDYREYGDPGQGWHMISHGNTKAIFEALAKDLNLFESSTAGESDKQVDSEAVVASLVEAFIGSTIASRTCDPSEATVLEAIMEELEIEGGD